MRAPSEKRSMREEGRLFCGCNHTRHLADTQYTHHRWCLMGHVLRVTMSMGALAIALAAGSARPPSAAALVAQAPETALRFEPEEIQRDFGVGYAVSVVDVNRDRRPDVIAINGTQLVWFENSAWTKHVLLDGQTPEDNVAIAPQDIDGDGRPDIALGAGWNPRDTTGGGALHWVRQPASGDAWPLMKIGAEPTLHRIRWANVDGRGAPELIVAPLHGRGTSPPEWAGAGARVLAFRIPADPAREQWEVEVADDSLHILHNFAVVRFDEDERDDLVTASREGVHVLRRGPDATWTRTRVGDGAPGEIALGRVGGRRILATVEPWHGHSVVLYLEPDAAQVRGATSQEAAARSTSDTLWTRHVIEEQIDEGHALRWADFDGDEDEELVVGWRGDEGGVAIYEVDREANVRDKIMIDDGGMAAEDLAIADLDADGRPEIVASGRRTENVKIYWNRTPR
ncbi:MAG: hypothetical protein GEU99_22960 [Luteitalea sp.]|nr:hypothetical protein [Luteitalea sp.]